MNLNCQLEIPLQILIFMSSIFFSRYVIKATTYEIGILADVPDNDTTTDNGPVTRQQVDLTFYNTESNGTDINFGDIPFPVETTGLKGQVITGITRILIVDLLYA